MSDIDQQLVKTFNDDFLEKIGGNDVISLAETHIHSQIIDELCIPGYTLLAYESKYQFECQRSHGEVYDFLMGSDMSLTGRENGVQ